MRDSGTLCCWSPSACIFHLPSSIHPPFVYFTFLSFLFLYYYSLIMSSPTSFSLLISKSTNILLLPCTLPLLHSATLSPVHHHPSLLMPPSSLAIQDEQDDTSSSSLSSSIFIQHVSRRPSGARPYTLPRADRHVLVHQQDSYQPVKTFPSG